MSIPWPHALRDAGLLTATLALWQSEAVASGELVPSLLAGGLATLCGYLAHEWGHFAGARLGGSVVHLPSSPLSGFLFRFDSDRNRREQFLAMSLGGFVASAAVVALFVAVLPRDALAGQVALGLTLLGVLAPAVLELPPAWRVARGAPIPRGLGYPAEGDGAGAGGAGATPRP